MMSGPALPSSQNPRLIFMALKAFENVILYFPDFLSVKKRSHFFNLIFNCSFGKWLFFHSKKEYNRFVGIDKMERSFKQHMNGTTIVSFHHPVPVVPLLCMP